MPLVNVRWSGQQFPVDVNTELEPLVFKSQLFELTGVVPERQKVVVKGKTLSDDNWNGITLTEGQLLMMLGSTGSIPVAVKPITEDSAKADEVTGEKPVILPIGLQNLGNTCYMNATLQSFLTIPELVEGVRSFPLKGSDKANNETLKGFSGSVAGLFRDMKTRRNSTITPAIVLSYLHSLYPQFATRGEHGGFQQQDANECYAELLRQLSSLAEVEVNENGEKKKYPVTKFLEGEFDVTMKNKENEEEAVQKSKEKFLQLSCFLSQEVRYVQSGIKSKLTEEIEKNSTSLNRNCIYEKNTLISRLPAYLSVQMVRFFYKEKDQINAKILKDVKFPMILDVFDCCTPELQARFKPQRDAFKDYEDAKVEQIRTSKLNDEKENKTDVKYAPSHFEGDIGSNNSGFYQLNAIITHKGRSSNSGHYVGWVRLDEKRWAMCDDDEVHEVTEDQIQKLSGGGDWHCAYVLVYGPRKLPILEKSN